MLGQLNEYRHLGTGMADDSVSETIRRVLAATWRGDNTPKPADEISRNWCLDLQWFSTDEAESAVSSLAESGWFIQSDAGYCPPISTKGITAPLGFCPRLEHLTNPTIFSEIGAHGAPVVTSLASTTFAPPSLSILPGPTSSIPSPIESDISNSSEVITSALDDSKPVAIRIAVEASIDHRMKLVPRLIKYVGRKAGIEVSEIERRMERKQLALGPITPWMCLILIAKEQGLLVDDIVIMFQT